MHKNLSIKFFLQKLRGKSKIGLIVLNIFVYLLLFIWTIENIHIDRLLENFRKVPYLAIVGTFLLNSFALAISSYRLSALIQKDFRTAFSITNIGYSLNTLFPFRLGEVVKIYMTFSLFKISASEISLATAAEKLADLIAILILGLVAFVFVAASDIKASTLVHIGILSVLSICGFALLRNNIESILIFFSGLDRFRSVLIELQRHTLCYPIGRIILITAGLWLLNILLVYFSFNTYLLEVDIGIFDSIALLVIIALSVAIPAAPAGLGLFEAGIVVFLVKASDIEMEPALVAATVFHFAITAPQLLVSAWLIWSRTGGLLKEE